MRGDRLEPLMRRAGFVDIQVRVVKIEIGEWGQGRYPGIVIVLTTQTRAGIKLHESRERFGVKG